MCGILTKETTIITYLIYHLCIDIISRSKRFLSSYSSFSSIFVIHITFTFIITTWIATHLCTTRGFSHRIVCQFQLFIICECWPFRRWVIIVLNNVPPFLSYQKCYFCYFSEYCSANNLQNHIR